MSCYSGFSYRVGRVVEARGAAGRHDVDAGQARGVARRIKAEAAIYFEQLEAAVRAGLGEAASTGNTLAQRWLDALVGFDDSAEIFISLAPGYVIDFPKLRAPDPDCPVSFRSCLTICSSGASSKVWTRTVSSQPVTIQDTETLIAFREASEIVAAKCYEAIRPPYAAALSEQVGEAVDLAVEKELFVIAADTRDDNVANRISEIYENATWQAPVTKTIEGSDLTAAFRQITGAIGIGALMDLSPDNTDRFDIAAGTEILPYQSKHGTPSIFLACESANAAYAVGLAGVGNPDIVLPGNYPQGVGLTAEIAAKIGSQY